jgi:hypothetical protein
VLLGEGLDLVVERRGRRHTFRDMKGYAMLAPANAEERKPGSGRLFLVAAEGNETNPSGSARAVETFRMWTHRDPDRTLKLEVPDSIGYRIGRVIRIGYRSDKFRRRAGTWVDYEHDFAEPFPVLYATTTTGEGARGYVLTGGRFVIGSRGIED